MTKLFVQPGNTITRTNPGGSASGDIVLLGTMHTVALDGESDTPTGALQALGVEGVFDLPKVTSLAVNQGDVLYYDGTAVTPTVTGDVPIGRAWEDAITGAAVVNVRLSGVIPANPTGIL